jgi:hypothetical protein
MQSLPIRGINKEYYQICMNCYDNLDNLWEKDRTVIFFYLTTKKLKIKNIGV